MKVIELQLIFKPRKDLRSILLNIFNYYYNNIEFIYKKIVN